MREIGFEDVTERTFHVPIAPWARGNKNKILGAMVAENLSEGVASMSTAAFTRLLGWSQEQLETFLARVMEKLKNINIHAYVRIYFVYGKKPTVV